jgi:GTP-binding protein HflX
LEKLIAVALRLPSEERRQTLESLEELSRLAETAGGEAAMKIIQTRKSPDPAYLIGRGKAQEIAQMAAREKARTVLFDNELSPGQQRNLENVIDAKIVDRTRLILDIFARRAHTKEASLQVELAQSEYFITRLTQKGIYMDNQVGGIGARGPGERKLEYDRRRIRDKITRLKREIGKIKEQREIRRARRRDSAIPLVSIIGYTNAGKSTLLNLLVAATTNRQENPVYADDKLFATLDTTTRRIRLPSGRFALITDTVGFIRKLPHQLVASFRSTLEETADSDLLLHTADISAPDFEEMESVVVKTIAGLGADKIPVIKVYNKIDIAQERAKRGVRNEPDAVYVSAKTGEGTGELLARMDAAFAT